MLPRLAAAAAALLLCAPATAMADVFCVQDEACVAAGGTAAPDLAAALAAAEERRGPDVVELGAGRFEPGSGVAHEARDAVEIAGEGAGRTAIVMDSADQPLLRLAGAAGSAVRDVALMAPQGTALSVGDGGDVTIADSLVVAGGRALAVAADTGEARLTADHVTALGQGAAAAVGAEAGAGAVLELRNSVISGFARSVVNTATATATASHSALHGPAEGQVEQTAPIAGDPGFASPAALDGRLRADSPLIDASGTPGGFDGDGDGESRRDAGAIEFRSVPPVALVSGPQTAVAGFPVTFEGGASYDSDPGDSLTYAWQLAGGAASGALATALLDPGTHAATLTVRDRAGLTATASFVTTVLAPPPPFARAPDITAPVISELRASPRRVRHRRGTRLRFRLSENARVAVTLRRGRRTVARLGGRRRMGDTRVLVPSRPRLRPGRYRAALVATDSAGNASAANSVTFRVLDRPRRKRARH